MDDSEPCVRFRTGAAVANEGRGPVAQQSRKNDLLLDVRLSYQEVVRKTVQVYLEQALGLVPSSKPLISPDEVKLLQKRSNISDYWDLANAFIICLQRHVSTSRLLLG